MDDRKLSKRKTKRISIVIATRNAKEDLRKCLDSIRKVGCAESLEVIVSDNHSQDGTGEMLKTTFPWVRHIYAVGDIRYSSAVNRGLRAASGDYILLLDSDVVLNQETLSVLVSFLEGTPRAGVAVAKMYYPDGTVQMMARKFPGIRNALFGRESILTRLFPRNPVSERYLMVDKLTKKEEPFEADWASAACMMVRREVIDSAGCMDEGYMMYWADTDWCKRIGEKGWKIFVVPHASVIHDMRNNANNKKSMFMILAFHQGAYRFFRKHYTQSGFHPLNILAFSGLCGRAGLQLILNTMKRSE